VFQNLLSQGMTTLTGLFLALLMAIVDSRQAPLEPVIYARTFVSSTPTEEIQNIVTTDYNEDEEYDVAFLIEPDQAWLIVAVGFCIALLMNFAP
jgi:hypothetical protein